MRTPKTTSGPSRIVELDALRGLAALAVVLFHYTHQLYVLYPIASRPAFSVPWGRYGVPLFFILSGFVIPLTLARRPGGFDFLVLRVSRLYPVYWVAVCATVLALSLEGLPGRYVSLKNTLVNLTMLQSHLRANHVDGAYWSLAVELSFYFCVFLLFRAGLMAVRWQPIALWTWLALGLTWRMAVSAASPDAAPGPVMTRLDEVFLFSWIHLFAAGMAFYALHVDRHADESERMSSASRIAYRGILFAAPVLAWLHNGRADALTIAGIVVGFFLTIRFRPSWLRARVLLFLGSVSYALYLVHQNIGYIVIRRLDAMGVEIHLAILCAFALSLGLAIALHHLVELPAQRTIRRRMLTGSRNNKPADETRIPPGLPDAPEAVS